ncbi:MAG: hypothetical protein WAX04_09445 [Oscillospiraceae bacterium]
MGNTTKERIRPTPAERIQVNSKISLEVWNWADDKRWDMRCSLSYLVYRAVEFAIKNEKEFIAYYKDIHAK